MGYPQAYEDDEDEDEEESFDPDDDDVVEAVEHEASSVDTEPCPYCGKHIYEQAELCPHCGSYISREDAPSRKPLWIVVVAGMVLVAILLGWVVSRQQMW